MKKSADKTKTILISLIIILFVFVSGLVYIANKPKTIFAMSMNKASQSFFQTISFGKNDKLSKLKSTNAIRSNIDVTFNLDLSTEDAGFFGPIIDLFNTTKIKMDYYQNDQEKENILKINPSIGDIDTITILLHTLNTKRYVFLDNIFDRYIELDDAEYSSIAQENVLEDLDYLLNKFKYSFMESLKDSDFSKESERITIDGKDINTNKITFILNDEKAKKILISIFSDIKNDEESLEAMVNVSNGLFINSLSKNKVSKNEISKNLDDIINELTNTTEKLIEDDIHLYIYTKKFTNVPIKYDLSYTHKDFFNQKLENNISFLSYKNTEKNAVIELLVKEDNKTSFNIKLESLSEDEKKLSISSGDDINEGYIEATIYKFTEEIVENKEFKTEMNFTLNYILDGKKEASFESFVKTTTFIDAEFENKSIIDPVKYTELTYSENEHITNKIMEILLDVATKVFGDSFPYGTDDDGWQLDDEYSWQFDDDYNWDENFNWDEDINGEIIIPSYN